MVELEQKFWGLDIGGTKIEICCFSKQTNSNKVQTHLRERTDTQRNDGYDEILLKIKNLCLSSQAANSLKISSIGIGHPGTIDPSTETLKNSNTTCFNGKPFYHDISKMLHSIGVRNANFANDANCFALAESNLGAGKDYNSCFGVILGTGVGGGLVINDTVIQGLNGLSGEWGHISIWDEGPKCYCGKRGCIETIISGPALEAFYYRLSNRKLRLSEIAKNIESDVSAKLTMKRFFYWLNKGLASVVNIVDPECIILGGGLSNIDSIYDFGNSLLSKWSFSDNLKTPILKASLGDSSGVFGAGLLNQKTTRTLK